MARKRDIPNQPMMFPEVIMESFPNLPKDPAPSPAPAARTPAAPAAAPAVQLNPRALKAASSVKMMYVWIGAAVAAFGAIGYWGMLRPNDTGATPPEEIVVPNVQTAAQRAESDALAELARRMKEQQEASRVIVLDGGKNPPSDPKSDPRIAVAKNTIRFSPASGAQPATRPTTIGGRTKPFLAPDVAEDGSFFGQIDKATGKPKTVYSSNQGKYTVDPETAGEATQPAGSSSASPQSRTQPRTPTPASR